MSSILTDGTSSEWMTNLPGRRHRLESGWNHQKWFVDRDHCHPPNMEDEPVGVRAPPRKRQGPKGLGFEYSVFRHFENEQ